MDVCAAASTDGNKIGPKRRTARMPVEVGIGWCSGHLLYHRRNPQSPQGALLS